ncbi:MAG: D-alanyl-D-alanine carboxypeptidase family protein, partial [Gemmata sp.]
MTRWFQPFALASAVIALASAHAQPPGDDAPPRKAAADTPGGPPVVTAKGWAVADGETGKLLWGSKEKDPLPLASTSKIMTAHVVLTLAAESEKVLDEVIHFSERADKTPGTSSDLKAGDKVAVRDLLYGLLLPSGNDAATALAEHFGARFKHEGKDAVERFVAEMNRTAKAVGMQ